MAMAVVAVGLWGGADELAAACCSVWEGSQWLPGSAESSCLAGFAVGSLAGCWLAGPAGLHCPADSSLLLSWAAILSGL